MSGVKVPRFHSKHVLVVAALVASAACAAAPINKPIEGGPVATGAGSLVQARKFLEGRWVLESFDVYPPGKDPISLKGTGTLTYDKFSNLRVEIRADRPVAELLRAAGIDIPDNGAMSSDGRTAIDLQNRTLTYVIQGQPPNETGPLALNRPRHWEVDGDGLKLTTQDDAGKVLSLSRWKKLED